MDAQPAAEALTGRVETSDAIRRAPAPALAGDRRAAARRVKRAVDVVGALVLLALLWPLFVAVAVLVSLDGGPVFYGHRRVGRGGRAFDCLKFRTMIPGAAECLREYLSYHPAASVEWHASQKLARDPRVTPVGAFLRRSSLDELPQLVNVLRGEMSLVGPRPVTRSEMEHYGPVAALYASVPPGMTGLWQVSGRSDVGYAARVALDQQYVERWSLLHDLAILLVTPRVVLQRSGAR
ncbi:sugar transferase [Methylobacterium oryzihabitans]|uniref:Sugar transferase n=1 Tax=Methylobacterium oryzihabitans TaxID=2499852 RepID=A0A3S2YPH9_9HYPH|nr:sugar transferase [Methylobacterium oryzihabitans]RVU15951.1 sugar transferase [Methylobacterium oryzihabitans]